MLLSAIAAALFLMLWDLTPRVASQNGNPGNAVSSQAPLKAKPSLPIDQQAQEVKAQTQKGKVTTVSGDPDAGEDPDLPPFLQGQINKQDYLQKRAEHINMLRGLPDENAGEKRDAAIELMNRQEGPSARKQGIRLSGLAQLISETEWTPLGPSPIPNGQTEGRVDPVSGRTISIAIHPTNPDIVYVGTAQGGLYRSLNGGVNWTQLMDIENASTPGTGSSLAIGAVVIDPANTTTVFVGTGEPNFSGDSFIGRGVYRIRNAETAPAVEGPFGLSQFNNRAVGEILLADTNPAVAGSETIFVCTNSAIGTNPSSGPVILPPRGIFRSTDAQAVTPTFTKLTIQGVAAQDRNTLDMIFEPGNPNVLLLTVLATTADGGGIYRTNNALAADPAAVTFTRTLEINGFRAELAINKVTPAGGGTPVVTVLAATGDLAPHTVAPNPPPPGACPVGQEGLVRRSVDGGQTWQGCPGGVCGAPVPGVNFLPGSQGFCGGQCFYDIAIDIHPNNLNIQLGGSARGTCQDVMKRSVDGNTFARDDIGLHADSHAAAFAPSNPNVVYTGNDGGIWRSNDAGDNWISRNNMDFSATQFQDIALHPFDRFFTIGGTQDNGTNCLQPDGTWRRCDFGDGGYALIDQTAGDTTNVTMYHTYFNQRNNIVGYGRVFNINQAQDGGWQFLNCTATGIRCADNVLFYAPMDLGPDTADSVGISNTVYYGSDRLYRSRDRGTTMQLVSQGPLSPLPSPPNPADVGVVITTIDIFTGNDNVRVVGLRNNLIGVNRSVFATTTGSNTLVDITNPNFPALKPATRVAIDPTNPNTVYVSFGGFGVPDGQHVWKTTNLAGLVDGSVTPADGWVPAGSGIPDIPVDVVIVDPLNPNTIYAGTDVGIFRSIDAGANWSAFSAGLPRVAVFDLEIANAQRILRAATHGRGIYEISLPGQQQAVIRNASVALVNESCPPANNVIDPGERVSVSLSLQNVGPASSSNLIATLLPTGGVVAPSGSQAGSQSYGSLASGETASRTFSFTADAACGGTITLTFQLSDGTNNLGTVSFTFTTGNLVNTASTFTENFDDETPPALPVGWSTLVTLPGGKPWITTNALSDTAPNSAATVADVQGDLTTCAGGQGGADLTSQPIAIPNPPSDGTNPSVQLSFRNFYNLEGGFDGGVLEISVNGGAFQDIIAAGGSFATGGYNGTLEIDPGNPLSGRAAWTASSGGFISTLINLPASANGQTVQFKWRTGYDGCFTPANGGMRIDTISVFGSSRLCNTSCSIARLVTTTTLARSGSNVVATVSVQNQGVVTVNNVALTQASLGAVNGTPIPQSVSPSTLAPGQSGTATVTFANPGSAGQTRLLRLRGTYTGGTFSRSQNVTLP